GATKKAGTRGLRTTGTPCGRSTTSGSWRCSSWRSSPDTWTCFCPTIGRGASCATGTLGICSGRNRSSKPRWRTTAWAAPPRSSCCTRSSRTTGSPPTCTSSSRPSSGMGLPGKARGGKALR
ncbi:unnamed protein product, partial [Ectocarpus fasciculatus]